MLRTELPGTTQHKALLEAICDYYREDSRILALIVFGSLGRGDWDELSDIDLDIVIRDDTAIQIETELQGLCDSFAKLGEKAALIVPFDDEGDVLLESLLPLSIRYHPLQTTSPNIIDSMRILEGTLDSAAIVAAGEANRKALSTTPKMLVLRALNHAASASVYLERGQPWLVVELMHRARDCLIKLHALTHNGERSLHHFGKYGDFELQNQLAATLPCFNEVSLRETYLKLLDLFEHHLQDLSGGQIKLSEAQLRLLASLRSRIFS